MSKSTPTHATQPARRHINVLGELLKFIPRDIIHKTSRETGFDLKAWTYSVLSHLGTMIFAQLAHVLGHADLRRATLRGTEKLSQRHIICGDDAQPEPAAAP